MDANKRYISNPYFTGNINSGEISGVWVNLEDELEWSGHWNEGKFIVTGYTIKSLNSLIIIDSKNESNKDIHNSCK